MGVPPSKASSGSTCAMSGAVLVPKFGYADRN
jgi:hypothetical protein